MNLSALDPVEGQFPKHASLQTERVLHVHLGTPDDPQAALVRALQRLGSDGYLQINWVPINDRDFLQRAIVEQARALQPTVVFMQLQTPDVVHPSTVAALREAVGDKRRLVVATWCGDVANNNSPWNVGWQVGLGQTVDLTLHTSMTHVEALRAAGVSSAAYLQIGYDQEQYSSPGAASARGQDIVFLGNRYYSADYLRTMCHHDAGLRDAVIGAMQGAFGGRFALYGGGFGAGVSAISLDRAHLAYQAAKIGLNVSLCNFFPAYSSDRIFRILGCGSLLLAKRFPLMSSYGLVHGESCLAWDTPDEAVAIAQGVLSTPTHLDRIAGAGAQLARERHTWDYRMGELSALLEAVRGGRV